VTLLEFAYQHPTIATLAIVLGTWWAWR